MPLSYTIAVENLDEFETWIKAKPSCSASTIRGFVVLPGKWRRDSMVIVNWSCMGAVPLADAREFFKAGLEVCDRVEALCREKGIDPNA